VIDQPSTSGQAPEQEAGNNHRETPELTTKISVRDVAVYYGDFRAIQDITIDIPQYHITAIIGPSGCGKSTLIRALNRMTDLVPNARATGEVLLDEQNILAPDIDVVDVRRRIGMVFQRANPFPKTIYDNVAFGPRLYGVQGATLDEIVEKSLRDAALWNEQTYAFNQLNQSSYPT